MIALLIDLSSRIPSSLYNKHQWCITRRRAIPTYFRTLFIPTFSSSEKNMKIWSTGFDSWPVKKFS